MKYSLIAFGAVLVLLAMALEGGEYENYDYYHHDRVLLMADRSLISIKLGVAGLVFDTSDWGDSNEQLAEWRFVGGLRIDSIVQNDFSRVALTEENQLDSVYIKSPELCEAFKKISAWMLLKEFPNRVPADTLYEDNIRNKTHKIGDLSVFYEIRYDSLISYDTVSFYLSKVPGLEFGRSSVPVVDSGGVKAISPR